MIETGRLIIREYREDDIDAAAEILTDPRTMAYWPSPLAADAVRSWLERSFTSYALEGFGLWAVVLKETNRMVGDCGILRLTLPIGEVLDLGYIIHHPYWGHGYATEAAEAVKRHAFKHFKIKVLHANMPYNHTASKRVAEKIGMRRIGEFENPRNRNIRTLLYAVAKDGRPVAKLKQPRKGLGTRG